MCILVGCSKTKIDTSEFVIDESDQEMVSEENNLEVSQNTEVMGSISHGVVCQSNAAEEEELKYEGGEIEIPYSVNGTGVAASCGFLIYLDGIPQPYKIKGQYEEEAFLHTLELEEGQETYFTFLFTPITGKKGDELSLCIASITNPDYQPDMKETFSYGHSHKMLEMIRPMKFLQDTERHDVSSMVVDVGSGLTITSEKLNENVLDKYTEHGEDVSLDQDVITELYIDGEDMQLPEYYETNGKDSVHIQYKIMGHPGLKYKTVFYLNHKPVYIDNTDSFETILKKGKVETIEFDLEISNMDSFTFYTVSVPCNPDDYPNDGVFLHKTHSIFFDMR